MESPNSTMRGRTISWDSPAAAEGARQTGEWAADVDEGQDPGVVMVYRVPLFGGGGGRGSVADRDRAAGVELGRQELIFL
jgi:hypothetical protein